MLGIALAAGADVLLHCGPLRVGDERRLARHRRPAPGSSRNSGSLGARHLRIPQRDALVTHLAAYYAARKHGEWAFAFARYLSVPVRFKAGAQPAWPAHGWEFKGQDYDPRCKYARAFPSSS